MIKNILLLLLFKLITGIGHTQTVTDFKSEFEWLVGTWQIETDGGNMLEEWNIVDSNTLKGVVNFLSVGDKDISKDPLEEITLKKSNDTIYFISVVNDQNDNLPVTFIYIGCNDGWYQFENKNHDFPQIISYKSVNKKNMHAKIEGSQKGKNKVIEFKYKRLYL